MTTATQHQAKPAKSQTEILLRFVAWEFWRNFRMLDATFFVIVLPAAMYMMFGVAMDQGEMPAGYGNISAYVMTSMAVYGAVIATTSMAGSAAVERSMGWGRQLNLTGLRQGHYIIGKMLMALLMAISPSLSSMAGALTGAGFDSFGHWLASAALCLVVRYRFLSTVLPLPCCFAPKPPSVRHPGSLSSSHSSVTCSSHWVVYCYPSLNSHHFTVRPCWLAGHKPRVCSFRWMVPPPILNPSGWY